MVYAVTADELKVIKSFGLTIWRAFPTRLQLSDTTGEDTVAAPVQSPVVVLMLTGPAQVICGFSLSVTVTVNEQVGAPQLFVAVKVTVVMPLLKALPEPLPEPVPIVAPVKAYVITGAGSPVDEML